MTRRKSYPVSYLEFGPNKAQKPAVLNCQEVVYSTGSVIVGKPVKLKDLFAEKDSFQDLLRIVHYEGKPWAIFKDAFEETPFDAPLYHARPLTKSESLAVDQRLNECLHVKSVYKRVVDLQNQAKIIWLELCSVLARRIPSSLKKFAKEYDWISTKSLDWKLPQFIEQITTSPAGCVWNVKENELEQYGFKNLIDCFNRFIELQKAWKGLVDLQVELFDYFVQITFKAVD